MEFERSIFRMHERLMLTPNVDKGIRLVRHTCCLIFVYMLLSFVTYHKLYVNKSSTLEGAIENQLLWANKNPVYQKLPYSDTTDKFIFCNIVTFNRTDTTGI